MSNIIYFFKESLVNFKRNLSTSVGGIITIFLSLLIIGIFMVVSLTLGQALQTVQDRVTIRVYLADEATQTQIDTLTTSIQGIDGVSGVTFISKEAAVQEYEDMADPGDVVLSQIEGDNPLPASLNVELSDSTLVESVASEIGQNQTFLQICDNPEDPQDSIRYAQEQVERLFVLTSYVRYIAIGVVALLVFVAIIFINNTIRLAIMNRRREIAIMRLVGASNGFIRGPFLMEGVIQAIVGAALATLSIALIRSYVLPALASAMPFMSMDLDAAVYTQIYIVFFAAAIVIGLFGSALAMRRYLKI